MISFYVNPACVILILDVQNEKNAQNLFSGIEKFDTGSLKHTETQEKNPLPDQEGVKRFIIFFSLFLEDPFKY